MNTILNGTLQFLANNCFEKRILTYYFKFGRNVKSTQRLKSVGMNKN